MVDVKDRLTVVEMVYHQGISEQLAPTQYESRYDRQLDTVEQVYHRTNLKVGEDWEDLDFGWIAVVGLLLIRNDEGKFREIPTEEEQRAVDAKILEIGSSSAEWIILPGESQRAQPCPGASIHIRSASGVTRYTITVIPG